MHRTFFYSKPFDPEEDRGAPRPPGTESPDLVAMRRYLSRLALEGYPFIPDQNRIRPFGGGFNNRIYNVDTSAGDYLVKVYPADRVRRMERECAAMERLAFLDGVPKAVTADPRAAELNAPVLIYEKLPGSPVEVSSLTHEDLDLLLSTAVAVHGLSDPGDAKLDQPAGPARPRDCLRFIDGTRKGLASAGAMNDPPFRQAMNRLRDLRRYLDLADLKAGLWEEAEPALCHGDFRPANLLKSGTDRVGLVDWEHAGMMDPCYEVAGFFCHPESATLAAAKGEEAIAGYCERSGDPHAREKIAVYQAILPVQWSVRILSLIEGYDRQAVQPWNELRPLEALWEDLDRFLGLAAESLAAGRTDR